MSTKPRARTTVRASRNSGSKPKRGANIKRPGKTTPPRVRQRQRRVITY